MNIGLFASAFYPHLGGVEELCRQLASELRRRDVGVVVFTNRWPRSLPTRETVESIEVIRLPFRMPDGSMKSLATYYMSQRLVQRELCNVLLERQIDLIHVQCITASTAYAINAHCQLNLPLVVSTQGERTMDATGLYDRSPRMVGIFRDALSTANSVTACSADTLDDVRKHFKLPDNFGQVIYNGVCLADFNVPTEHLFGGRPYVLALGRHVPQKGFDVLLRAWAMANISSHMLILAGDGPERNALEKLAVELNIIDRVRFFGPADRRAAIQLFSHCSCFVLPSRREPLGIVVLEAMAAGKAVVATDTGGVPELVENSKTGVLVPPENIKSLAQAIGELAGNANRCEELGTAARKRAEQFDWLRIADQYQAIYRAALGEQH